MFIITCYSADQTKRMRRAGHVARMEEKCLQDFGGEIRGKVSTDNLVEYLF